MTRRPHPPPRNRIDWRAVARKAWPHLVAAAKYRRLVTYGWLGAKLGVHHRNVRHALAIIQEEMRLLHWPAITGLVVNQTTGVPGDGFQSPREGAAWRRVCAKVYADSDWPTRAPF